MHRTASLALAAIAVSLSTVTAQQTLWTSEGVPGPTYRSFFGENIARVADLDGDGVTDLLAGARQAVNSSDITGPGYAAVLSGRTGTPIPGYHFVGDALGDLFGLGVADAGDVDGDGTSDLVVGATSFANDPKNGYARVFSGATAQELFTLTIPGATGRAEIGYALAGIGDVNGDGRADVLVAARDYPQQGAGAGRVALFSGADGSILYAVDGDDPGGRFGTDVAGIGDVDADGYPDFLVGAPQAGPEAFGAAYVFSGATGSRLYTYVNGDSSSFGFGRSVAGIGDVNLDGRPDFVIGAVAGAHRADVHSGIDGSLLYRIDAGATVSLFAFDMDCGFDVTGDGVRDLLITAKPRARMTQKIAFGGMEVYSGRTGARVHRVQGTVDGGSIGESVALLSDIDGDGWPDAAGGSNETGPGGVSWSGFVQTFSLPQVGPAPDPILSTISTSATDPPYLGEVTIVVRPRDALGTHLGPGQHVYLRADGGTLLGILPTDHGDGSYSQVFETDYRAIPSVVEASVNGEWLGSSVTITPAVPVTSVANADLPVKGDVVNTFVETHDRPGEQRISEVRRRFFQLEHKWTIAVPGGSDPRFFVLAERGSLDGDDFEFHYSLTDSANEGDWTLLVTADRGQPQYLTAGLDPAVAGQTVFIRVRDTVRTTADETEHTCIVRHMGIAVIAAAPPAAPTGLVATAASSSRIDLSWTDNATNETSFEIERSPDGANWGALASVAADVTTYSDTGLAESTRYWYRVFAANAAGSSASTDPANATTLAASTFDVVATGEIPWDGTITGSFTDTHTADGVYESIREVETNGNPQRRTSKLSHEWTFSVPAGAPLEVSVKSYIDVSPDADHFVLEFSDDGWSYQTFGLTVTRTVDDGSYQTVALPTSATGSVWLRVRDSNRAAGANHLDAIHVDHLFVSWQQ